jgi:hypothetical protein
MPAGNTYEAIASTTLGSTTQTVTFSSIPSTYTDLILIMSPANSAGSTVRMQFNGDTNTNYSDTYLKGNGTTAASLRNSNQAQLTLGDDADPTGTLGESVWVVQIMNYSNTTTYKTVLTRANVASADVEAVVGMWRSTSAINQIDVKQGGSVTFSVGSTFSLYGIKAA